MQEFIEEYNFEDDLGRTYGWSFQNYAWVYQTIIQLGLNPEYGGLSEQVICESIESQWKDIFESEQLSDEEQEYWTNHERMEYPLTMAYTPAYSQLIQKTYWINIMLMFFVVIVLSESFSTESARRTRKMVQVTNHGPGKAIIARICAGETVVIGTSLLLYLMSAAIQFSLFGTDGFNVPIQQIGGLQWSMLMISAGRATLLLCGTSILLAAMVGAVTMLLSELTQSSIAAIAVPSAFFLLSLLFDYGMFYENRLLSQIWNYFPLQRANIYLLYDERFVTFGNRLFTAIPFSTTMYLVIAVLSLLLCAVAAMMHRRDRN